MKFDKSKFLELNHYKSFLKEIEYFEEIDSTNSYLLYRRQNIDRVLVIADYQTAGRGRYSRKWMSNAYENLMFTLGLSENITHEILHRFSFLTPISIVKSIYQLYGITAEIKWPNDVLVGGKKLCGILIESVFESDNNIKLVIGVGINVNQTEFEDEIRDRTTSLKLVTNWNIAREELLAKFIDLFYEGFQLIKNNFEFIYNEYMKYVFSLGKQIRIQVGTKIIEGKFKDVNQKGELILEVNGNEFPFSSGDITILKE